MSSFFGILEQRKHEKACLHENFGMFQLKLWPADVMTFFFALHLILGEKLDICVPVRDDLFLLFT